MQGPFGVCRGADGFNRIGDRQANAYLGIEK